MNIAARIARDLNVRVQQVDAAGYTLRGAFSRFEAYVHPAPPRFRVQFKMVQFP